MARPSVPGVRPPVGWMALAPCPASGPSGSHVLARVPGRPHSGRQPADRLAPHDRRLRGLLACPGAAPTTPRDAVVRAPLVGRRRPRPTPREALARTRSRRPLRQHPRQLRAVPRRHRPRLARGSAHPGSALGAHPADRGRDRGRHPRHAVRPPGVGLRVRRVHEPGDPEDHHRVGATDPRDRSGMARDRVGVRGCCLPGTPRTADTVDGTRHPRAVPPARPVGATRDRVVGHGRPGRRRGFDRGPLVGEEARARRVPQPDRRPTRSSARSSRP